MAAAITFNYADWIAAYPVFAGVSEPLATTYFVTAGTICANDACNPMLAQGTLEIALNVLTAHIAWLMAPRDANGNPSSSGSPVPQIVGRVSSASEGSVNVSVEWNGSGSPSEAWFLQTQWGALYWQMTAQYRTWRYAANPTIVYGGRYPLVSTYRGR